MRVFVRSLRGRQGMSDRPFFTGASTPVDTGQVRQAYRLVDHKELLRKTIQLKNLVCMNISCFVARMVNPNGFSHTLLAP